MQRMAHFDLPCGRIDRRQFLKWSALSAAGLAAGCASNPVTGKSQLMLVSEQSELKLDRQHSPHQLSADYGTSQDMALNAYVQQVGQSLVPHTHRPEMPYQFHVVNATYVNAYAFPGGTIAATRGILLKLENEAELAALLGHELGHVNARHTARQMSKQVLSQVLVSGVSVVAGAYGQGYGELASRLGMMGSGALLAGYSRENEREADDLGLKYMTQAGYGPKGFAGLMGMLQRMSKKKAGAFEMLFATHPMSDERYQTAVTKIENQYQSVQHQPLHRDRYMDHTAGLRKKKAAIEQIQRGDQLMAKKQYAKAEQQLKNALQSAPDDYAALVMLSKCMLVRKKYDQAAQYARDAQQIYPTEAQAHHLGGFAHIRLRQFERAYMDFSNYEKHMRGNPQTMFYQGYALEGMQRKRQAAEHYVRYLQTVNQGEQAQYAYKRLVQWGVIKK